MIVVGSGAGHLEEEVRALGGELVEVEIKKFPDGENTSESSALAMRLWWCSPLLSPKTRISSSSFSSVMPSARGGSPSLGPLFLTWHTQGRIGSPRRASR